MPRKSRPDRVKNWTLGMNGTIVALFAATVFVNAPRPADTAALSDAPGTGVVQPVQVSDALVTAALADAAIATPALRTNEEAEPVKLAVATNTRTDIGPDLVTVPGPRNPEVEETETVEEITPDTKRAIKARQTAARMLAAATFEPAPQKLEVTGRVVNARSGPGTDYTVVQALKRGQPLTATGMTQGRWTQVTLPESGEKVWMHSAYIN